jgi:four helix bundle protein
MNSHSELRVWQESMNLVEDIYRLTLLFPKDELFGLTSQIRRSVVSIPSNIAEEAGRSGEKEWTRFLYIALGSLSELDTQYQIAVRLKYVDSQIEIESRIRFIRIMLTKLIDSLNK